MRTRSRTLGIVWLPAALTGATLLQLGGCSLSETTKWIANYNPCGTILICDPVTYEFIRSGYEGPGADPDVDPACTYPPYCDNDPFVSSFTGQ
jgi:hypothetical protein